MGHTSELKCSKLLVKRTWDLIAQIVEQRRFVIDSTDSISLNFTTVRFPPWELNISDLNLRLKSEISWNRNRPWTLSFPSNTSPPRTMRTLALLKVFFPRLNRTSIIWRANLRFTVLFQWALHDLVVCPTIDYMSLYQKHGMQSPFYSCFCLNATRKSKGHCEAWSLPRLRRDCRGLNLTDYGNPYQPHKGLKMNI